MKIFVDGHFMDGRKHGVAIYLDRIYSHYIKIKPEDEIHFGLNSNVLADNDLFRMPNVFVHRYDHGGYLRYLYDVPLLAKKINPDVIHTQYVAPMGFCIKARRHVTLHDVLYEDFPEYFDFTYRWSRKLIFGQSAKLAEYVSTVSDYSKSRISKLYNRRVEDIHLTYNGVDEDFQDPLIGTERISENNIVYVSRFEKRKNHIALLKSLVILRKSDPSLKLVFVGFDVDGTLAKINKFITGNNLEDVVKIKSHINDEELKNIYKSAGVIVYPSFGEGFGMPIIEAFMLNPNVLFSNTTAMAEFPFAKGKSFNPYDISEITEKIKKALNARSVIPAEWQSQRFEVMKKYSWNRSAIILADLYHSGAPLSNK